MRYIMAHPGGRPLKFKDKDDLEKRINEYFESCKGHPIFNEKTGDIICNKKGEPIMIDKHPPTMSGLAYALGTNRRTLLNYEGRKEYERIIDDARTRVEICVEENLLSPGVARGAMFNLQNNFKNWKAEEKQDDVQNVLKNMQTMADILKTPQPDRDITDFEK
jgi:hypothetical protein